MDEVKLRIKSPSLSVPDLQLTCNQDETVLGVKRRIEAEYETHPLPGTQKLVYSGKLLQDEQKLREFLRFEDECSVFTVHLVCKLVSSSTPTTDGLRNRKQKNYVSNLSPTVPVQGHSEAQTNQANELQEIQSLLNSLVVPGMTTSQGMSPEEMQQYQAIYSQYMDLYTQYMQNQSVQQHEPPAQQPQQNQEPAPAAADPAEEQGNNDLLDYAYAIIRVVILFCIMYVHSSFFRLLFVAVGIMLVYMLQSRTQRQQQQRANNNQPPPAPVEETRDNTNDTQEVPSEPDSELNAESREPKPNIIMVAFTFLTTLFSSIIPDQVQAN